MLKAQEKNPNTQCVCRKGPKKNFGQRWEEKSKTIYLGLSFLICGILGSLEYKYMYINYIFFQAEIILMAFLGWYCCDRQYYKGKAILFSIMLYVIYIAITDWIMIVSITQKIFELIFFAALAIFNAYRNYDFENPCLSNDKAYLAFWKPKTRKMIPNLISIMGCNTASMSMIVKGYWYRFDRENPYLQCYSVTEENRLKIINDYILIEIDVPAEKIEAIFYQCKWLPNRAKARRWESLWLRFNCVRTFKDILNMIGGRYSYRFMDWLPSIKLMRLLHGKK